ncbi:MAG TPA: MATE family efflux transporter [Anaerovoracaceae bacterium]|nr:MATE family efflux transporter [Anaerovoracaceae bacterium]
MNKLRADKEFYRTLAAVALPIALQSLISSSLTLVDNLMVGQLGESALSSVGLAIQIFHVQWMVLFGFCTGCSTFTTQFWGIRDLRSIRKVAGLGMTTCLAVSAFFFLGAVAAPDSVLRIFTDIPEAVESGSRYVRLAAPSFLFLAVTQPLSATFRATQQTKIPLYVSSFAFGLNTLLNYLLIFGHFGFPAMGIRGAALATMISRMMECTLMLSMMLSRKNILSGRLKDFFSFNLNFVRRMFRNATPTTVNEGLWGAADAAYNAAYGRLGITAYAAVQASSTIMNLFAYAAFSVGDASLILVGERLGRGDKEGALILSGKLIRVGITVGAVFGILMILLSGPILGLFELSTHGIFLAGRVLLIKGLFLPLSMYIVIHITGTLRSGGDTKFAMFCEVGTMWLVGVPLAFLGALYLNLPVYTVVLLVQAESLIKALILQKRYRSGKWLKNMIQGMDEGGER